MRIVQRNHQQDSSRFQEASTNRQHGLFPFKSDQRQAVSEEEEEASGDEVEDVVDEISLIDINAVGEAASEDEDIASGRKCIDKVMIEEVIEYDEVNLKCPQNDIKMGCRKYDVITLTTNNATPLTLLHTTPSR